ncbi:aminopeptidase [Pseudomonas stutzeri]|nr:aminopeptidase [Stutzerimonas stutzeri]
MSRLCLLSLLVLLTGCSSLGYYAQLAGGQWQLLRARQPVAELLADPAQPAALRQRLRLAQDARAFASAQLALPDNRSYRLYADLGRPYVVWNLFATPELSLQPVTHCFPVAGCVAYRGWFDEQRARGAAARLRLQGLDTEVAGVAAYSTLGWFDDPLLAGMLAWNDERLAGLIFHELAHQRLYLPGDTAFNESYARFVEEEGLRQWRRARALPPPPAHLQRQREQFVALVMASRARLEALYARPLPPEALRALKQAEFQRLRGEYAALRDGSWQGDARYDGWFARPLNNARLLPFGLYEQWLPAFAALFAESGGDWSRFHARAVALAGLEPAARRAALEALQARGGFAGAPGLD